MSDKRRIDNGSQAEQEGRAERSPDRDPKEVPARDGHEQREERARIKGQTTEHVNRDTRHKDESVPRHTTKQHSRPENVSRPALCAQEAKDGGKAA